MIRQGQGLALVARLQPHEDVLPFAFDFEPEEFKGLITLAFGASMGNLGTHWHLDLRDKHFPNRKFRVENLGFAGGLQREFYS